MATFGKRINNSREEVELRRGPWTLEEDTLLIHYVACHGEGRWNLLAKCAGGKDQELFRIDKEGWKELQIEMAELLETRRQPRGKSESILHKNS